MIPDNEKLSSESRLLKDHVIALTGGIATGKSTVATYLKDAGWVVLDADQLAREVVARGTPGLARLVEHFGTSILDPDGHLVRSKLRERIFATGEASSRRIVEAITHPLIRDLLVQKVVRLLPTLRPPKILFYEAALIFESNSQDHFKEVWLTACSQKAQLSRLIKRSGWSEEEALKVIKAQGSASEKMRLATRVVWTEEPPEVYCPKLKAILDAYSS